MSTDITSNNTGWWYTFQTTNQYIYTINDSKLGQKKGDWKKSHISIYFMGNSMVFAWDFPPFIR
jgi:hypothetical protein